MTEKATAIALCGLACLVAGCSGKQVVVLRYEDFGPPSCAYELIGSPWYQWDTHGYEENDFEYNIRVVVFDGLSEESVQSQYPTVVGVVDYRYVRRKDAITFLKESIEQCETWYREDPSRRASLRTLAEELRATLRRIERRARAAASVPESEASASDR